MEPGFFKNTSFSVEHPCSGFSLLELMVCLAIIAIAFTAALGLQSSSLSTITEARFKSVACLLAQKKIAEIETADPDNLVSESGDFGDDYPEYIWNILVEDIAIFDEEAPVGAFKRIDLNISLNGERYNYDLRYYKFFPSD